MDETRRRYPRRHRTGRGNRNCPIVPTVHTPAGEEVGTVTGVTEGTPRPVSPRVVVARPRLGYPLPTGVSRLSQPRRTPVPPPTPWERTPSNTSTQLCSEVETLGVHPDADGAGDACRTDTCDTGGHWVFRVSRDVQVRPIGYTPRRDPTRVDSVKGVHSRRFLGVEGTGRGTGGTGPGTLRSDRLPGRRCPLTLQGAPTLGKVGSDDTLTPRARHIGGPRGHSGPDPSHLPPETTHTPPVGIWENQANRERSIPVGTGTHKHRPPDR